MTVKIAIDFIVFSVKREGYLKCRIDRENENIVHFNAWHSFDGKKLKGRAFISKEKAKEYDIICNKLYQKLKRKLRRYL